MSWDRPFFAPGGGDPFLFYAVFGDFGPQVLAPSAKTYRIAGIPEGIETNLLKRDVHAEWLARFFEGNMGRLLDDAPEDLGRIVGRAPSCLVVSGRVPDPPTLSYLRDVVGIVAGVLDSGGVAVMDAFSLRWQTPADWNELFEPDDAVPLRHVDILVSEDEPKVAGERVVWIHTRGLRKFGRPDLSIRGVTRQYVNPVVDLCNRFIVLQARGGVVPEGQTIHLPGLPEGMTCRHAGDVDDPDFNNVHLSIRWPYNEPT